MPPDSTSTSSFVQSFLQNQTVQLLGILLTIIGGVLAMFPNIRLWVIKKIQNTINYISLKFGNSKQRKIQSQVTHFLNTKIGKKYILNHPNQELTKKIYTSFSKLRKHKIVSQIEEDVYYVYLFSLLEMAVSRIWAASISDPLEWTDSDEEKLFLELNINASNRKIPVERIFIIKESEVVEFLNIVPIQKQILHNEISEYYFTYYAYESQIPKALLREIANGFLAFDDFVVAKDVFSDKEIRGIIETESLAFYNKIFTKLRQFTHPLDITYYKSKTGNDLTA